MHLSRAVLPLAAAAALVPAGTAAAATPAAPTVTTGGVSAVTPTGATVNGTANANGAATDVFVEYGAKGKLSQRTPVTAIGSQRKVINLRIPLSGLSPVTKYSYRVVARNAKGGDTGTTRTFTTPRVPASVTLAAAPAVVAFGDAVALSGTVGGTGAGGSKVQPEQSGFPYTAGFGPLGNALIADPAGAFAFTTVPTVTTQYRVQATVDGKKATSPVVTVGVAPKVGLSIRRRHGRVSFSGTIAPGGDAVVRLQRITSTGRRTTSQRVTTSGSDLSRYRFRSRRIRHTTSYVVTVTPANGAFVPGESRTRTVRRR